MLTPNTIVMPNPAGNDRRGHYLLLQNLKLVANAPDRFQVPLVGDALQLFSQALDVDIHRPGIAEVVEAPYLVQQLVAGIDPVGEEAR